MTRYGVSSCKFWFKIWIIAYPKACKLLDVCTHCSLFDSCATSLIQRTMPPALTPMSSISFNLMCTMHEIQRSQESSSSHSFSKQPPPTFFLQISTLFFYLSTHSPRRDEIPTNFEKVSFEHYRINARRRLGQILAGALDDGRILERHGRLTWLKEAQDEATLAIAHHPARAYLFKQCIQSRVYQIQDRSRPCRPPNQATPLELRP